jgi:hypothetical protein
MYKLIFREDSIEKKVMALEYRQDLLENRQDLLEERLEKFEYQSKNLERALIKLRKKDYSYENTEERNFLVVAAVKFAGWKRKHIAELFNLSTTQVGNIVNNPVYS